jgi:hypothetical protein
VNALPPWTPFLLRVVTRRFQPKAKAAFPVVERLWMKRIASLSLSIVIVLCLMVASERRAWGYVDPGSGLIAIQAIASVIAAWAYMVRRRIRAFFSRKKEEPPAVLPVPQPDDSPEAA